MNWFRSLATLTAHPFLFAAFPTLFLFAYNRSWLTYYDVLLVLMLSVAGAAVLFFVFSLVFQSGDKAGIITSLFVFFFFSYGHVYEWVFKHGAIGLPLDRHRYLLPLFGFVFVSLSYAVLRSQSSLRGVAHFLNVTAIVLICIALFNLVAYEFTRASDVSIIHEGIDEHAAVHGDDFHTPDIYYIILDSYAGSWTLEHLYDFDNSDFVSYLENREFYVVDKSISNYASTDYSLPSSLNMDYLDASMLAKGGLPPEVATKLIRNNQVLSYLKLQGYTTVNIGHWWGPTSHNEYADLNFEGGRYGSEFITLFLRTTVLAPFIQEALASDERTGVLNMFDLLSSMPQAVEGSKFVFAHFLTPHNPFIFGPNGEDVDPGAPPTQQAYLDQLTFVNKKMMETVDTLLSESATPPVILIQSDHGHGLMSADKDSAARSFSESERAQLSRKASFRNFSAYYLPHGGEEQLYESITPVNSFRVVLSHYFNAPYTLLPDRAYILSEKDEKERQVFVDVTEQVAFE